MQIGDLVQGGIVFYVDDTGENGLVAATNNYIFSTSSPIEFRPPYKMDWRPFGNNGLTGANGVLIGEGIENHQKILDLYGDNQYISKFLDTLNVDGLGWHLPSLQELQLMWDYTYILPNIEGIAFAPTSTEVSNILINTVSFRPVQGINVFESNKTNETQTGFIVRPIKKIGNITPFDISTISDRPIRPESNILEVFDVTETSMKVRANFSSWGNNQENKRKGIIYNTIGNPYFGNISQAIFSENDSLGEEIFTITGLSKGITYYISSFGGNEFGIKYSPQVQQKTIGDASNIILTTKPATNISKLTVTLNGNSVLVGSGLSWEKLGFLISLTEDMDDPIEQNTSGKLGDFSKDVIGLFGTTTYFFQAYAITYNPQLDPNRENPYYTYGEILSFTTTDTPHPPIGGFKNPDKYLRTAYVQALKNATGLPVYAKSIPAGTKAKKYIILDSQSKSQTVKAKINYFEWLSRINVNIYSINDAGNFAPLNTDDIEEQVLAAILVGVKVEGFHNKNTDLISTQDLSLDFQSKSVDRKLLIFEHWLAEKEETTT